MIRTRNPVRYWTGIKIPLYPGSLHRPFSRPEPSRDRDSGGVGFGLAIVKTGVEACKGTVSAANIAPNGFAVTIILNSDTDI